MTDQQRHYYGFTDDAQLCIVTWCDAAMFEVCHVDLAAYCAPKDYCKPWNLYAIAVQVAHGILCHHLALELDMKQASHLAAFWRDLFAYEVIIPISGNAINLTDTVIAKWLVKTLLDHVGVYLTHKPTMPTADVSRN